MTIFLNKIKKIRYKKKQIEKNSIFKERSGIPIKPSFALNLLVVFKKEIYFLNFQ